MKRSKKKAVEEISSAGVKKVEEISTSSGIVEESSTRRRAEESSAREKKKTEESSGGKKNRSEEISGPRRKIVGETPRSSSRLEESSMQTITREESSIPVTIEDDQGESAGSSKESEQEEEESLQFAEGDRHGVGSTEPSLSEEAEERFANLNLNQGVQTQKKGFVGRASTLPRTPVESPGGVGGSKRPAIRGRISIGGRSAVAKEFKEKKELRKQREGVLAEKQSINMPLKRLLKTMEDYRKQYGEEVAALKYKEWWQRTTEERARRSAAEKLKEEEEYQKEEDLYRLDENYTPSVDDEENLRHFDEWSSYVENKLGIPAPCLRTPPYLRYRLIESLCPRENPSGLIPHPPEIQKWLSDCRETLPSVSWERVGQERLVKSSQGSNRTVDQKEDLQEEQGRGKGDRLGGRLEESPNTSTGYLELSSPERWEVPHEYDSSSSNAPSSSREDSARRTTDTLKDDKEQQGVSWRWYGQALPETQKKLKECGFWGYPESIQNVSREELLRAGFNLAEVAWLDSKCQEIIGRGLTGSQTMTAIGERKRVGTSGEHWEEGESSKRPYGVTHKPKWLDFVTTKLLKDNPATIIYVFEQEAEEGIT
jgi:hypothetical protein